MADGSVVFVEFIELSLLEEDDCVPQLLFNFPILLFKRSEIIPRHGRDVNRPRVIIRVIWTMLIHVHDISKPWIAFIGITFMSLLPDSLRRRVRFLRRGYGGSRP